MQAAVSASAAPLWQGSVAFVILAAALGLIGQLLALRGKVITRHESGLWCFLVTVLSFLMCVFRFMRASSCFLHFVNHLLLCYVYFGQVDDVDHNGMSPYYAFLRSVTGFADATNPAKLKQK